MTKKEKAEVDELISRVNTLAALRWTEEVKPDIPKPDSHSIETCGWYYLTSIFYGGDKVETAWSSSGAHGTGPSRSCRSQGGISLFSTELLALKALRHSVEKECATRLYRIDRMIEQARANPPVTQQL